MKNRNDDDGIKCSKFPIINQYLFFLVILLSFYKISRVTIKRIEIVINSIKIHNYYTINTIIIIYNIYN